MGKLGFFLSVIMISAVVTSLIVNIHLYRVNNQLDVVCNQLKDELSGLQIQIQDLERILLQHMGFQTISKGYYSGHKNPAYYVIENESEWAVVWNQHASIYVPEQPPPEIDFSKVTIIAVFMGEFNTGGYEIEIKEVINTPQCEIVKVEKTYPSYSGAILTFAFSQPYHIVKMNKVDKEITFATIERKYASMSQLTLVNYEATVHTVKLGADYVTVKGTLFNSGDDQIKNIFLHIRICDSEDSLLKTEEIPLGTIEGKSYKNFDTDIEAEGANSVTIYLGSLNLA